MFTQKKPGSVMYAQSGDANSRQLELVLKQWNGTMFGDIDTQDCTASITYSYRDGSDAQQTTDEMSTTRTESGSFLTTIPVAPLAQRGIVQAQVRLYQGEGAGAQVLNSVVLTINVLESIAPDSEFEDQAVTQLAAVLTQVTNALADVDAAVAGIPAAINAQKGQPNGICPLDSNGMISPAYLPALDMTLFGARWDGSTSPVCTRLGDAVGMAAGAMIGGTPATNNFDGTFIATKLCNIMPGSIEPVAYEGDPDFALDGSNGNVFVEVPLVYYKRPQVAAGLEAWFSDGPYPGFEPHPLFVRPDGSLREKVYVAAYEVSYDSANDRLQSISGAVLKVSVPRSWYLTKAAILNPAGHNCYFIENAEWCSYDQMAGMIEFATLNMQAAIGAGLSSLQYNAAHTATVAETSVNRVIVANATAALYEVGQQIDIGTSLGGRQVAMDRTITAINTYDVSNKAIEFDGAAVSVAVGNILYNCAQKTGGGDALGAHSGRAAGTDGKTCAVRRGVQNPFGNVYKFIANAIRDVDNYMNICRDPAKYALDRPGGGYAPLGYAMSLTEGYAGAMGFDPDNPWALYTTAVTGSSSTRFCDYLYRADGDDRVVRRGGYWSYGSTCGPWSWYVALELSSAALHAGARLLILPD